MATKNSKPTANNTVTLAHVAEAANVSKMTVSRVLNGQPGVSDETRQRIIDTIHQMGYVANAAAQTLRGQSRVIGLVVPGLTSSYMGAVMNGISQASEALDYGLMLYTQVRSSNTERSAYYASLLSNGLTDGVVLVVPYNYELLVNALKDRGIKFVIVDHHSQTEDEPAVIASNRRGVMDAMRHLLALGHRRIGFITGRMSIGCSQDRLQGYRDALAEVGLPYEDELVLEGDFERPVGFSQTQCLLESKNPPTAIFASNDDMAFGAMDAIKDAGLRVGLDISVVGFDDSPAASEVYPKLTTVRQPMAEMGKVAVELLIGMIEGKSTVSSRRELPTELIVRDSTGRVRS
jgi:LacI family transcriptional regulator